MAIDAGAVNLGDSNNLGSPITPLTLSASSIGSSRFLGDSTLLPLTLSGSLQGPSELPEFTLTATGFSGGAVEGDLFLPGATASGAGLGGLTGIGASILPELELYASMGTKGDATLPRLTIFATGLAGNTSKSRVRVVAGVTIYETQPTLDGLTRSGVMISQRVLTGDATLEQAALSAEAIGGTTSEAEAILRPASLSATGLAGTAPAGALELPGLTLSAVTADGVIGTGSALLPEFTLEAVAPAQPQPRTGAGDPVFDELTLQATMLAGSASTGVVVLREPTLSAFLANSPPMTGDVQFAEFTLEATALGSNAAIGAIRISELSLTASQLTGNAGTATVELPLVQLSASDGVLSVVGAASLELPLLTIGGAGIAPVGGTLIQTLTSPTFTGIVLNTRSKAVSTYAGLSPNSATLFNGVTLMATSTGIVALLGDTDRGAAINAYLTTGKTGFNSPEIKRVLTAYVGYRADGDMELTAIADDHHESVYSLSLRRVQDQMHATRVKLGRGASGVYWQFKASNVDGADFAIDRLELLTALTGNKV